MTSENQLRDQGRQIEPGRAAAGESPVNQDRAVIGYQHVVSAQVARSSGHLSPPVMPWRDPRRRLRQATGRHMDCSDRIENSRQVPAQRAGIGVTSASIIEGEHDPPGDLVVPAQRRSRDARRDQRCGAGLVPVRSGEGMTRGQAFDEHAPAATQEQACRKSRGEPARRTDSLHDNADAGNKSVTKSARDALP